MNSRAKFLFVFASTTLVALLLTGAVIGKSASRDEGPYKHLAVFTEVLNRIRSEYVEEPNMKSVTVGALNGMLESIDPFASYLNADQYKEWAKKRDAHKGDVGLVLAKRSGMMNVVGSLAGSPAAQAGIQAGDWIESITGVATRDMPLAYAEILLRGAPGSTVELSVLRSRRPEPQKIVVTRAVVQQPPVEARLMREEAGYIRPMSLVEGKVAEVAAAVKRLEGEGARRIVLDLRNCSLGPVEAGVELANLFLDSGLITYATGQKYSRENHQADPAKTVTKLPVLVIANRGTAGAAEVAAGALLDAGRANVAGERSYGAAAVTRTVPLDDGGAIILSVAKYYSPSGKSIPDNGVMPQKLLPEPEAPVELDENGVPIGDGTVDPAKRAEMQQTYLEDILNLKPEDFRSK
ncbi:MAG: PDZ domain-containing protein [Bryobacterales bacterium]|nr:PDZ domain-containing protein [Bryobacterales bacterium]